MKRGRRAYALGARKEKMEATRAGILDAAVALYLERGVDEFTLEETARRAEVTVQTLLRIHGSRDRLFYAALDKMARAGTPMKMTPPGDVAAAVSAIVDVYETLGDLVMQQLADERRKPQLKKTLDEGRGDHREWVGRIFAPQLAKTSSPAERARLFEKLVLCTDVYVWAKLRRDVGLDRGESERIMREVIEAVVI